MASKSRAVICLLRNNLRYHDNEVFLWAQRNSDFILPVYCFDPRHYKGTWHFNFPKTGPHRLKFLLESVADFRNVLKEKGSGLVVRCGKPETVVPEIIKSLQTDLEVAGLVYEKEATKEEIDVEEALRALCDVPVKTFWGTSLYHRDDLPFKVSQVPNVYSEFRKQVENRSNIRPLLQMPEKLKPLPSGIDEGELPTYQSFGMGDAVSDDRTSFPFSGGETAALARLHFYLWDSDKVATYKETRNGLIGEDYSTKFSPWLAHGCISPRQIYWEIKRYEEERTSNQSTYWVIFELIWRDYFKFVALKFGDKLFYRSGVRGIRLPWKKDMRLFEAWKSGNTGVPFVDANMREMAATGFMSNRGRQNVASFLVKDLGLDWLLGAEWFEHLLTDHDVCSNYGNWQYSAGVGNDPRQDRKFNMVKQGLDYDPQGDYIRRWVPELSGIKGGDVHIPWTLSPNVLARADVKLGETYPQPIVIAPEWSRHIKKPGSATRGASGRGGGASGRGGGPQKQRGIDFYFKGGKTF